MRALGAAIARADRLIRLRELARIAGPPGTEFHRVAWAELVAYEAETIAAFNAEFAREESLDVVVAPAPEH